MKRLHLFALIAALLGFGFQARGAENKPSDKVYKMYGVAFYNLENLFDTINNNGKYDLEFSPQGARQWDSKKYWSKIDNLAWAISSMTSANTPDGPAIIGVSEIENRSVLEDLVKAVDRRLAKAGKKPWNLQIVHHDSPDRRGVDVACLYNPRQFRFLNVSNSLLTIEGNPSFRSRDQMCVTGILAGDTLSVIVNHWPSRLGGQEQSSYLREAAAALSKHIADSLWTLRPNQGVIVMGDLNDDPQNASCAKVLGAKKDTKGVGPHGFYNPWWKILDKGIGTLAYKGQWNLFDQIIVSGTLLQQNGSSLYFKSAKVNNFPFLMGDDGNRQKYPLRTYAAGVFLNGFSDHYPTEIFLIKERDLKAEAERKALQQQQQQAQTYPPVSIMPVNKPKVPVTEVAQPSWSRDAVIYEVNWRQMTPGGTIGELTEQLPRLKDLGADILWLMPIHPISELNRKGELGSYYAVKDYTAVNPELGNLDQFKDFVKKAHEAGFKVIIDWVPNHSGCDNAWVAEHPDWYARNEKGEMFGPYDWTDVFKFDYSNPEMRRGMIDAMKFWIEEADIDGFRCDVAMEVPTDFWNEARPQLDAAKHGEVFMLAEASNADLVEKAFNMAYNWPMKDVFNAIAATAGQNTYDDHKYPVKHAGAIIELLNEQEAEFPADSYMMNMITNHDLNTWEGTEFKRLGNLTDAFAVLSFTLPGMPLIYTGQETGMDRAFEFFVKDVPPTFEPRNSYFDFYQKLTALKHANKALAAGLEGGEMVVYPTDSEDILVFSRSNGDSSVLVMTNLGNQPQEISFQESVPVEDLYGKLYMTNGNIGSSSMVPGEYRVYVNE